MNGEGRNASGFHLYTDDEIKAMHLTAEEIQKAIRRVAEWADKEMEKAFREAKRGGDTEK